MANVGNQLPTQAIAKPGKHGNVLPLWGNEKTMNLNPMILTNVLSSPYFKVQLYELKTYHEVVDEIYFKVTHIEPWEKGSRKTAGQTGMCGGVRGVGTGGIVSTAFCLLYKLFTLKLTRKQLMGLITHTDSPYIRALGFMYIRYTQPPADLLEWYDGFMDDEEELDVKAGGGCVMTIGEMLRSFLTKLEWFSTLFPRIPVPVQKQIDQQMKARPRKVAQKEPEEETDYSEAGKQGERRHSRTPRRSPSPRRSPKRSRSRSHHHERERRGPSFDRELERERDRQKKEKDREGRDRDRDRGDRGDRDRRRSRSADRNQERRERKRSCSGSRERRSERREKERDGGEDRSRRKERDHHKDKDRGTEKDRSRERKNRGEADERRHKDDRDRHREDRKSKRSSRSRSRDRRHKSGGDEKSRKRERSHSRERDRERDGEQRHHKRSGSKERNRHQREASNEHSKHSDRRRSQSTE
ncbi:pre-mRNA-splicing factor 38B [Austrofundulus limnaeus]|uniref:Pre-mRNA-splicing factor 38B n=1 Tax=Austrofundulus limnaeus TaxID=52670 RepID=A0A2I4CAJ8_AUSLI|nr:PREDICTED: pre-mRNA-splicing factor 38B [Austrofundulus limnaeus]